MNATAKKVEELIAKAIDAGFTIETTVDDWYIAKITYTTLTYRTEPNKGPWRVIYLTISEPKTRGRYAVKVRTHTIHSFVPVVKKAGWWDAYWAIKQAIEDGGTK